MRRLMLATLLVASLSGGLPGQALAGGHGPAKLAEAGWDCFQPPPDFNPYIHCAPPGQLEGIVSGEAKAAMFVTFATTDLDATSAPVLGTERLIRSDLYRGQPCPTDQPTYQYSSLFPRFGWAYHICHTFDSPW